MDQIDLRSDTVTIPTPEMRQAMVDSVVGDDIYEDDQTVNKLQKMAAEMLGKEDALFVPTGCFGNQLCLLTHTQRGDEIILSDESHIVQYELGAAAFISGLITRTLFPNDQGKLSVEEFDLNIRKAYDIHYPKSSLLCLEQPSSKGQVFDIEYFKQMYEIAKKNKMNVHLDGARLFNAVAHLGVDVKEITQYCDSVMFCLSKGLCSPVGSMICGTKDFIHKARYNRKALGGGMRQIGVLAGPGIISLQKHTNLVKDDNETAKYIAEQINKRFQDQIQEINLNNVKINMLFFQFKVEVNSQDFVAFLKDKKNILILPEMKPGFYRILTHYYIKKEQADQILDAIQEFLQQKQ